MTPTQKPILPLQGKKSAAEIRGVATSEEEGSEEGRVESGQIQRVLVASIHGTFTGHISGKDPYVGLDCLLCTWPLILGKSAENPASFLLLLTKGLSWSNVSVTSFTDPLKWARSQGEHV